MEGILEMVQGLIGNLTGDGDIMSLVNKVIEMITNFVLSIWGQVAGA